MDTTAGTAGKSNQAVTTNGLITVPGGLDGVAVGETAVGDVRGAEGFYHYRQYSAVDLAETRTLEDVAHLLLLGDLPDRAASTRFGKRLAANRDLPPGVAALLPEIARLGPVLPTLRTGLSALGAELSWAPTHDLDAADLLDQIIRCCATIPTIVAGIARLQQGQEPVPARADLGQAANYLWMLEGTEPDPDRSRALEQYLIITADHGFNASTFAARVITSTGTDLASAMCGALGALAGPLHGVAPSRVLDMLGAVGSPAEAAGWVREAVEHGQKLMGFGHRIYKTDDPRALFLRSVALRMGGPLVELATAVEREVVATLSELKPGRRIYTNVEYYAAVVLSCCGIPRELFTPTFASSRSLGWAAHVLEQATAGRLIRPATHYVGPPPTQPVPAA